MWVRTRSSLLTMQTPQAQASYPVMTARSSWARRHVCAVQTIVEGTCRSTSRCSAVRALHQTVDVRSYIQGVQATHAKSATLAMMSVVQVGWWVVAGGCAWCPSQKGGARNNDGGGERRRETRGSETPMRIMLPRGTTAWHGSGSIYCQERLSTTLQQPPPIPSSFLISPTSHLVVLHIIHYLVHTDSTTLDKCPPDYIRDLLPGIDPLLPSPFDAVRSRRPNSKKPTSATTTRPFPPPFYLHRSSRIRSFRSSPFSQLVGPRR
jgi:hypothetical protein